MGMLQKYMKNKQVKTAAKKLGEVSDLIPAPDVLKFFNVLTEAYKEGQATKLELAKLEAQKEIAMLEIKNKYELYHKVFDAIFDERRAAIGKSFDIIDRGLATGDKELISMGMKSLSTIVSSSPFANFQQLSNMLEGNTIIEI
jgi:hypothetical protein